MTSSTKVQFGLAASDDCEACGMRGDVYHVIEECVIYARERRRWIKDVERVVGAGHATAERRMSRRFAGQLAKFVGAAGITI